MQADERSEMLAEQLVSWYKVDGKGCPYAIQRGGPATWSMSMAANAASGSFVQHLNCCLASRVCCSAHRSGRLARTTSEPGLPMLPGYTSGLGRRSFESQPSGAASSARRMGSSRLRPTRDLEPIQQGVPLHAQQGAAQEAAANMSSPFAASQAAGAARQAKNVEPCCEVEVHSAIVRGQDATKN